MRISKLAGEAPGVSAAVVSMATDTNLSLMKDIGFDPLKAGEVSANDLVIAIQAQSQEALDGALALVESLIKVGPAATGAAGHTGGDTRPKSATSGDIPGSLDADSDQLPGGFENGDHDVRSDKETFSRFSRQNKHVVPPSRADFIREWRRNRQGAPNRLRL